jgi:uncharacterized membrane protein YfcA
VQAILGIIAGFVAGVMGGAFGVGGSILTTPAVQVLLGAPPYIAVGTPLPAIIPTTLSGAQAYRRAGLIDGRAVAWAGPVGACTAAFGAWLTQFVDPHWLLLVTSGAIGWQAVSVGWGSDRGGGTDEREDAPASGFLVMGLIAGLFSGLLGIGGGVVMVPFMSGILHLPLKRAIGTSLVIIMIMVIPGTIVHAYLGHIDWLIFLWLTIGVIPGAMIGSRWTVRANERTLRRVVGSFLLVVAIAYAGFEIANLVS